jgi:hypothetical protein
MPDSEYKIQISAETSAAQTAVKEVGTGFDDLNKSAGEASAAVEDTSTALEKTSEGAQSATDGQKALADAVAELTKAVESFVSASATALKGMESIGSGAEKMAAQVEESSGKVAQTSGQINTSLGEQIKGFTQGKGSIESYTRGIRDLVKPVMEVRGAFNQLLVVVSLFNTVYETTIKVLNLVGLKTAGQQQDELAAKIDQTNKMLVAQRELYEYFRDEIRSGSSQMTEKVLEQSAQALSGAGNTGDVTGVMDDVLARQADLQAERRESEKQRFNAIDLAQEAINHADDKEASDQLARVRASAERIAAIDDELERIVDMLGRAKLRWTEVSHQRGQIVVPEDSYLHPVAEPPADYAPQFGTQGGNDALRNYGQPPATPAPAEGVPTSSTGNAEAFKTLAATLKTRNEQDAEVARLLEEVTHANKINAKSTIDMLTAAYQAARQQRADFAALEMRFNAMQSFVNAHVFA